MEVSVILPVHNEEKTLEKTLNSILNQSVLPKKIFVILDNCNDKSKEIAQKFNNPRIIIFETKKNTAKKAGALNQAILNYSNEMTDYILIMDSDTIIDEKLIANGVKFLNSHPKYGAVCSRAGVIKPEKMNMKEKMLWHIQHVEYSFYDAERVETFGSIKVAHGMCTIYRFDAIFEILKERGTIYLEDCLTEDYELTLLLKRKWKITANMGMLAWTDVPLTLNELWVQRIRWLRGGVDSLRLHGFRSFTKADINSHMLFIMLFTIQVIVLLKSIHNHQFSIGFFPILIIVISVFDRLLRFKYIQHKTISDYMVIILIFPMILYSWFNISTLLYSYFLSAFNIKQTWQ